jgi:tyrosyl-tRNA synthetase
MIINTDKQKIEELLSRGVENIYPKPEFLKSKLESGEQLKLYTGYDPTGPTLHIGHGITLLKLRQFQDLGHKIIMLIGDFTGMIGDPTDKTSARQKLTREEVLENCKEYVKQASAVLDFGGKNPVEVKYNSEWFLKMNFADVLDLSSNFTVQRMMERDMFKKRVEDEKPIYVHEFMYPMMQGYDSVAMDVDGEVGGNDQTFNMLTGRTLMKSLKNKEKFVISGKLLADDSGKKMGKTEGNMVALSDSPEDMFGKVMQWTDRMIVSGFELCTRMPMEEVEKIKSEMESGVNPRDFKLRLAYTITEIFLGVDAAEKGKAHFEKVIQSKGKPEEIPELTPSKTDIITVLVEAGFTPTNSEARRAIKQGGVKINDEKIDTHLAEVKSRDVVQKGKRFFVKIM